MVNVWSCSRTFRQNKCFPVPQLSPAESLTVKQHSIFAPFSKLITHKQPGEQEISYKAEKEIINFFQIEKEIRA